MTTVNQHLAFVFPGQGSQSVGMLTQLAATHCEVKEVFDRASTALHKDLWALVTEGPANELDRTVNTQPALLAAGVAIWTVWCKLSAIRPAWSAGHSLGEYTALVCADAFQFEDAIQLVATRGHLMQEAVPEGVGAMAAILGLDDADVISACIEGAHGQIVSAVNFNAPGQVVIAGHASAVERTMQIAKKMGAKKALPLPVSVPSHCALMQPAAEQLQLHLANTPIAPFARQLLHNVDVQCHADAVAIRSALSEQLYKPVRWVETITKMANSGVNYFVECGPGKVLSGLNKRIAKQATHFQLSDPESLQQLLDYPLPVSENHN